MAHDCGISILLRNRDLISSRQNFFDSLSVKHDKPPRVMAQTRFEVVSFEIVRLFINDIGFGGIFFVKLPSHVSI